MADGTRSPTPAPSVPLRAAHAARCAASVRPASAPMTLWAGCWQTWGSSGCCARRGLLCLLGLSSASACVIDPAGLGTGCLMLQPRHARGRQGAPLSRSLGLLCAPDPQSHKSSAADVGCCVHVLPKHSPNSVAHPPCLPALYGRYDSSHLERSHRQRGGALDAGFELTLARCGACLLAFLGLKSASQQQRKLWHSPQARCPGMVACHTPKAGRPLPDEPCRQDAVPRRACMQLHACAAGRTLCVQP